MEGGGRREEGEKGREKGRKGGWEGGREGKKEGGGEKENTRAQSNNKKYQ